MQVEKGPNKKWTEKSTMDDAQMQMILREVRRNKEMPTMIKTVYDRLVDNKQ